MIKNYKRLPRPKSSLHTNLQGPHSGKLVVSYILSTQMGPPGVLGILGEWPFIFRELGSTGNYLRGAREQAHNFGDLGSLAKKQKNKEKPPFCLFY